MALYGEWCTIESDPGMFTNRVESFVVGGSEFSELWYLNDYSICSIVSNYKDVYGLVLLFTWQKSANDNSGDNNDKVGANNGRRGGQRRSPDGGRHTPRSILFQAGDSQQLLHPGHDIDPDQLIGRGGG